MKSDIGALCVLNGRAALRSDISGLADEVACVNDRIPRTIWVRLRNTSRTSGETVRST
jgi:hypothetical protein